MEPVELARLNVPAIPMDFVGSPAGLLRAEVALMRFRSRAAEMDSLLAWSQAGATLSARLIAGPPGQGKSRLAQEFANALVGDGWATVFITANATASELGVLSAVQVPTLVVVDYAEGRLDQLHAVLAALRRAEAKVRLLLLARTAGAWRTERVASPPELEFLGDDRIVFELGPLEPDSIGRQQAWREAVAAIASRLGSLDGYGDVDWPQLADGLTPPELTASRYKRILEVQLDALSALLRAGRPALASDVGDPLDVLLAQERRYWSRTAEQFGVLLGPTTLCAVTYATLYGAATPQEAHRVLAAIPGVRELPNDAQTNISDWLATLYGDPQRPERYWAPLQPDLLAEHLIGSSLDPEGACRPALEASIAGASPSQLEHAVALLTRAHVNHPALADTITATIAGGGLRAAAVGITVVRHTEQPEPLRHALHDFIDSASLDIVTSLQARVPRYSLPLTSTALRLATRATVLYRELAEANRGRLPARPGHVGEQPRPPVGRGGAAGRGPGRRPGSRRPVPGAGRGQPRTPTCPTWPCR